MFLGITHGTVTGLCITEKCTAGSFFYMPVPHMCRALMFTRT